MVGFTFCYQGCVENPLNLALCHEDVCFFVHLFVIHLFISFDKSLLRPEVLRSHLHLHTLHGVVGSVPAVPGDAVTAVLVVLALAVVHAIWVGVSAAVVPVAT